MLVLQHVGLLSDVLTACESVTFFDMFKSEKALVSLAHVIGPIVYRSIVCGSRLHHVYHDSRDIYLITPWKCLSLSSLVVVVALRDSIRVLVFLLLEEFGDSVLPPELFPCFL